MAVGDGHTVRCIRALELAGQAPAVSHVEAEQLDPSAAPVLAVEKLSASYGTHLVLRPTAASVTCTTVPVVIPSTEERPALRPWSMLRLTT